LQHETSKRNETFAAVHDHPKQPAKVDVHDVPKDFAGKRRRQDRSKCSTAVVRRTQNWTGCPITFRRVVVVAEQMHEKLAQNVQELRAVERGQFRFESGKQNAREGEQSAA